MKADKDLKILSEATEEGNYKVISYVLKHTNQIKELKDDMQFALIVAAARDYTDIGLELIKNGANVNYGACKKYEFEKKDEIGRPPIFNAVESAAFEFIELLLSYGADLNVFDDRGYTPLVSAYYNCDPHSKTDDVIRLLLERGADPFLGWRDGTSFADITKLKDEESKNNEGDAKKFRYKIELSNGYRLYSLWGCYGVQKDEIILIPPMFTSHIETLSYATCLYPKEVQNFCVPEVILLHEDIRGNTQKVHDIFDYYSTFVEIWLYDKERNHFIVSDTFSNENSKNICRVFKNGMYYLFSNELGIIISNGYSYINSSRNQDVLIYRLGKMFGYIALNGTALTKPVFTGMYGNYSRKKFTGYIEYTQTDEYKLSYSKRYNKMRVSKINVRGPIFNSIIIRLFWKLFYFLRYGNPERAFRKMYLEREKQMGKSSCPPNS
jgi:hypothetical protein